MSSDCLPGEIVFDILTRLPVKSICRFKCVSKSWLATISTPKFVKSHFDRSRSHPKLLISICTLNLLDFGSEECRQNLFIADRQDTEQEKKGPLVLRHQVTLPVPVDTVHSPDSLTVAGLSLSLGDSPYISVITNPITKASVIFPLKSGSRRSVCFGFDPAEGKHKIVESISRESEIQKVDYRVIYVSDSGNWRSVEGPIVTYINQHKVCIAGVIYSAALTTEGPCIVAFNVRSEKFQVAKLSINGRLNNPKNPYSYIEFEGKLAIVDYPLSNRDSGDGERAVPALDLWVLEDFENEVWSLKFSCLPSFALTRMLIGTTIDDELIFVEFKIKDEPFILHELSHYLRIVNFSEDEVRQCTLYFLNMKTGNFWSKEVDLPPEYHLKGEVRISAASLVERL